MNAIRAPGLLSANGAMTPRFREAGDLTLDRLHRDGRVEDHWLALHPREFAVLWPLAERPGTPLTCQQLLDEMCPFQCETEASSVAVHVARARAKLEPFGLARLIGTHPDGRYFLDVPLGIGAIAIARVCAG